MEFLVWPAVVLILVIFFLVFFKKEVSNLIARVSGVKMPGFKATTKQDVTNKPLDSASSDELMKYFDSKFLLDQEKRIKEDLKNRGINDETETIKVLTRHLAGTQVQLIFERIYTMIYGSQLLILQYLNTKTNGDTRESIIPSYNQVVEQYPETFKNYPFEEYMSFLLNFFLIEEKNNRLYITHIGRDFLTFITQSGKPLFKNY